MPSAYNASGVNMPPGFAVTVTLDRAILASPTLLATAIVSSGAPPKGVILTADSGIVQLSNWTMVTGSQFLIVGATYYVTTGGRLSANSGGQSVGVAVSLTELSVNISETLTPYIVVSAPAPIIQEIQGSQITASTSDPPANSGIVGTYWLNTTTKTLFGPRTISSWGTGMHFVT